MLRLLAPGGAADGSAGVGKIRTSVLVVALIAVTVRITAVALSGTARGPPVTFRSSGVPPETGATGTPPVPSRVSRMRTGSAGSYRDDAEVPYQPSTSATTCGRPAEL